MKTIMMIFLALSAGPAFADGFVCTSHDGTLKAKVFNHTDARVGTRVPAVLVLSDETIRTGRKTIAVIEDVDASSNGSLVTYSADVQEHIAQGGRRGELIAGTKLGYVQSLDLSIEHNFNAPIEAGDTAAGVLTLETLSGNLHRVMMDCIRYKKN